MGVEGARVADELRVDRGLAGKGVLLGLQQEEGGTFSENGADAGHVEGPARSLGGVVLLGEHTQEAETSQTDGVEHAVGAPDQREGRGRRLEEGGRLRRMAWELAAQAAQWV